ncbi:MAG: tetratricopeptide repeat protein [Thermodesulfobacteriota bacterium]
MTKQQELILKRASTRQFLLSRTDPDTQPKPAAKAVITTPDPIREAFPQVLNGRKFLSHAMAQLYNSQKFSALVLRIDNFRSDRIPPDAERIKGCLMSAAQIIDNLCQNANGLWGQLKPAELGCFFPEKTGLFSLKTAKKIRKELAGSCRETVSIGIAAYPTLNFTKRQVIENAYKALDHAAFFGPGSCVSFDAVSLNISGDKRYHEGDIPGAIEELQSALLLDPANVNVHNSLGVCYAIQGSFEKALESFTTAIQLDPGEVMSIYNAGLVHMLSGRQDKALARFLEALNISGDVFEILFQTGRLYLEMGNFKNARRYLEKAADRQPAAGAVYRYLGDCYTAGAMADKAVTAYRKAIKLNPNDAAALSALGDLFGLMGENTEIATMFCRQSIEISPDNGLYRHRLGMLYLNQNMLEAALNEFQKALKLGHDSSRYIEKIREHQTEKAS